MPATARKPAPSTTNPTPAPGVARLTLALDGVAYVVKPVGRAALPFGSVRGFTLSRIDRKQGRTTHTVADGFDGPSCTCPDQTYRQTPTGGICKHVAACQAVGLL